MPQVREYPLWVKSRHRITALMSLLSPKGDIGTRDHLDFIGSASSNPRRAWERIAIHVWDA
jgi:hypothetical protein